MTNYCYKFFFKALDTLGFITLHRSPVFVHGILTARNYSFYTAEHFLHYSQHRNSVWNSPKSNGAINKVEYLVIFFYLFTAQDLCEN